MSPLMRVHYPKRMYGQLLLILSHFKMVYPSYSQSVSVFQLLG